MNSAPTGRTLLRRKFTLRDQEIFAELSGDRNPMHIDPVAARRTLLGGLAVHGVHLALAALEALLEYRSKSLESQRARLSNTGPIFLRVAGLNVRFPKPVMVGEEIRIHLTEESSESCRLVGCVQNEIAFQVLVRFEEGCPPDRVSGISSDCAEPLVDASFEDLSTAAGVLKYGMRVDAACELFPITTAILQPSGIANVLALTLLVGMRCPGLHSIFSDFDVQFQQPHDMAGCLLHYRVTHADSRFRRLIIEVNGDRLSGKVTAFVRPPPERQPGIAEVAQAIPKGLFAGHRALIVGGSRGLGEITAKIIAAGGGEPLITYHHGACDAERLVQEIRDWGGHCESIPLDVHHVVAPIRKLFRKSSAPGSIYYFATPKISSVRRGFFNEQTLADFNEFYVSNFKRLLEAALAISKSKLRVLYPSSVFVTETPREMIEYAISKRTGEDLCAYYNRYRAENVEIIVERLPRLKTDQTMSLLPTNVEDTLTVMAPLVKRVEGVNG